MVPTSAKVLVVGAIGKKQELSNKKTGELFYTMSVAVNRPTALLTAAGKKISADWYTVVTNQDCSALKTGDYVKVKGSLSVKYWTPENSSELKQTLEIRADADGVTKVVDDSKTKPKGQTKPQPVGQIVSSSLG
jgi:single-stranded DNA-binding protein